ncbi:hypothetical protein HPSSW140_0160, partial [Glaesserella parasuis SW140]
MFTLIKKIYKISELSARLFAYLIYSLKTLRSLL